MAGWMKNPSLSIPGLPGLLGGTVMRARILFFAIILLLLGCGKDQVKEKSGVAKNSEESSMGMGDPALQETGLKDPLRDAGKDLPKGRASLAGKRVLMVIAPKNFRDEELLEPLAVLKGAGAEVVVSSSSIEPARGMLGRTVKPDILLSDVDTSGYHGVVFVGGTGASRYFEDPWVHELAQKASREGKVLGAICIAPSILANAGLLKGKRATSFASEKENLKKRGAVYTGEAVEVDGKVVTGIGPAAARQFGEELVKALRE